ncbi:hypothetical protein F5Y15DRAFT_221278 [Xylariaceae sp. FL0016]|nr:hypothetical protein F5Y15DRAFT_221278 [Xylariaceae sp. FL0016]
MPLKQQVDHHKEVPGQFTKPLRSSTFPIYRGNEPQVDTEVTKPDSPASILDSSIHKGASIGRAGDVTCKPKNKSTSDSISTTIPISKSVAPHMEPNQNQKLQRATSLESSSINGLAFNPFFTWRKSKKFVPPELDYHPRVVSRTLTKVHTSLNISNDTYRNAFDCPLDEFLRRHPTSSERTSIPDYHGSTIRSDGESSKPTTIPESSDGSLRGNKKRVRFGGAKSMREDSMKSSNKLHARLSRRFQTSSERDVAGGIIRSGLTLLPRRFTLQKSLNVWPALPTTEVHFLNMKTVLCDLYTTSDAFVHLFVPRVDFDQEAVLQKLWGAVETISRQAELSFALTSADQEQQWSIRPQPLGLARTASTASPVEGGSSECEHCKSGQKDGSLATALSHYHSHIGQRGHESRFKPYEDPCVVWLEAHHALHHEHWQATIRPLVLTLIDTVRRLRHKALEFGERCPRPVAGGKAGSDLPRTLVLAFEATVSLYCIAADAISDVHTRRSMAPSTLESSFMTSSEVEGSISLPTQFNEYTSLADRWLDEARNNALLFEYVDTKPPRNDIESVGLEFLLDVVLTNVQNKALDLVSGSDAVDIYLKRTSRLRYLIHSRPQKRLFIELNSLENELEAVRVVFDSQLRILENVGVITARR